MVVITISQRKYSMVHYEIKQYTIVQAKKYGYTVRVSINSKKKLDVYKNGVKIASIGDSRYKDYPKYLEERGLTSANVRRVLYYKRDKKDIEIKGSPAYSSSILLWWFRILIDNNPKTHRHEFRDSSTITLRLIDDNSETHRLES